MPRVAEQEISRLSRRVFRRFAIPLLLVAAILLSTAGLMRLRFDTEILSMMPGELPEVKGLKAYQKAFSKNDELVMLIEGGEEDEGTLADAAESLVKKLEADGVVKGARWKPMWADDPAALAEIIAYAWLNGDPEMAKAQVERLAAGNSEEVLRKSLENVGTAFEGPEMVMLAHDPFGFLEQPAVAALIESSGRSGEAFESEDGRSHLLFADAPRPLDGYRDADDWLKRVRESVAEWRKGDGAGLNVRFTGDPAFTAEIGKSMEQDLSGSISLTLGLIGILFWWMQRRFSLLLGLTGVLLLVFAVALGVAGWLYGELSIIALSSAEILIGLAVDYGLVICQEAKVAGHDKMKLRKASGPPVMFGALTTTVVFLALNLGGLPGMAQLGTIVAVGLTAAAVLMLVIYLPFVAKAGVNRAPAAGSGRIIPRGRVSWGITGILSAAGLIVLMLYGMPGVEFDSKIMRPRHSDAMDSLEALQVAFPGKGAEALGVVVEADSDAEMLERLEIAKQRLLTARKSGWIESSELAVDWWPDGKRQQANRIMLARLTSERERLLKEADATGYAGEGVALGRSVMEALEKLCAKSAIVFPESAAAREVLRLFLTRGEKGGGCLSGSVMPAKGIDPAGKDFEKFRSLTGEGVWLSGWELFKPAIAGLVKSDMPRMIVPMFVLLLGMMAVIFRRAADVGLALFAMAVSTLLLLAVMSVTGLKWNFINLMATPLLLGTGIDYAIHVTLSLRRTGGDFKDLWQGTGKALLFCGASNVIGFGSLIWSSSDALVSLGIVAVIGIVLCMGVSIFLLPGWRHGKQ
jgi:uncharacterized protein